MRHEIVNSLFYSSPSRLALLVRLHAAGLSRSACDRRLAKEGEFLQLFYDIFKLFWTNSEGWTQEQQHTQTAQPRIRVTHATCSP